MPSERELAQQYAVGRSSIREALRMLESKGVIRSSGNAGFTVAEFGNALNHSLDFLVSVDQADSARAVRGPAHAGGRGGGACRRPPRRGGPRADGARDRRRWQAGSSPSRTSSRPTCGSTSRSPGRRATACSAISYRPSGRSSRRADVELPRSRTPRARDRDPPLDHRRRRPPRARGGPPANARARDPRPGAVTRGARALDIAAPGAGLIVLSASLEPVRRLGAGPRGVAALVAVAVALAVPAHAGAHAGSSPRTPAARAVVEVAPKQVVLRFNQAVKPSSVRILDGVARPVPVGKVSQPQPNESSRRSRASSSAAPTPSCGA